MPKRLIDEALLTQLMELTFHEDNILRAGGLREAGEKVRALLAAPAEPAPLPQVADLGHQVSNAAELLRKCRPHVKLSIEQGISADADWSNEASLQSLLAEIDEFTTQVAAPASDTPA